MRRLAIILAMIWSVSLADAQDFLTPASIGLTATKTDSGITSTWNDIGSLGYTVAYRLYRTQNNNKTVLANPTGTSYSDTTYSASVPKIVYQLRVTVNGTVIVWSDVATVPGPFYELATWTSWGQTDIHPFEYPTGASSTKTFAELP